MDFLFVQKENLYCCLVPSTQLLCVCALVSCLGSVCSPRCFGLVVVAIFYVIVSSSRVVVHFVRRSVYIFFAVAHDPFSYVVSNVASPHSSSLRAPTTRLLIRPSVGFGCTKCTHTQTHASVHTFVHSHTIAFPFSRSHPSPRTTLRTSRSSRFHIPVCPAHPCVVHVHLRRRTHVRDIRIGVMTSLAQLDVVQRHDVILVLTFTYIRSTIPVLAGLRCWQLIDVPVFAGRRK